MNIRYRQTRPQHFQIYFTYQGKRIFLQRDALGEPLRDIEQVKSVIGHIEANGYNSADWTLFKKIPFDKTIRDWVKDSNCSSDWQKKRGRIAENLLIPHFKKQDVCQINDAGIEAFKKSLEARSKKTQRNYMAELKSFFKWMSGKKIISQIPEFKPIRYVPQHNPHWYTKAEQEKLFQFVPETDKAILTFLRWTGCRPNEGRGLQKEDVDWSTGQIYIRHAVSMDGKLKGTKTEKLRVLPIFPEIEECLKADGHPTFVFSRRGRPYSRRMLEKAWKKMVNLGHQQYGISILPLYQGTKHSLGNQMINEEGKSLSDVQAVFGHADIKSTMIYAKTQTSRLAEIMSSRSHFVHTLKTQQNQEKMAGVGGFEPPNPGSKDLCLTA